MSVKSIVASYCPDFLRPAFNRIENSPIGSRLAKGVFWSIAGTAISRGLMLGASVLLARMLGKTIFGELGIIQSTIGMLGTFAGFGLGLTATKHVAEFREKDPERAGRIIALAWRVAAVTGGLMALGLVVFAPWLANNTINAPHLVVPLRIGALILFISALNGAQTGVLAGFEAFKTIAHVNLLIGMLSFPILIAGAWFGGLNGAILALAINLGINWFFNHLAVRKEAKRFGVPLNFIGCGSEWAVLWKFSVPAVVSGALVGPVNWACRALLVNQPDGYGEMGIYSAAYQWHAAILFLPGLLSQVALPLLSNLNDGMRIRQYRKVLQANIFINAGASLAVVIPIILLADIIMLAYGSEYGQGANVLRALAFTSVLMAVNNVVGSAIASRGKMWVGFAFNAVWAVVLVTATATLLNLGYGAYGLACAMLIAYVFHSCWQAVYIRFLLRRNEGLAPHTLVFDERNDCTKKPTTEARSPGANMEV